MNKEQQIEEMARDLPFLTLERDVHISSTNVEKRAWTLSEEDNKIIAEALYNAGYRKTFTSDFASDTQKAYKEGYEKGIEETKAEIEILKIQNKNLGIAFDRLEAENERLSEKLGQILLSIDTVKEMNAMCNIDEQRKQAVKEFAEWIKDNITDIPFCNQKAYNVFCDMVNEKLKEYEI
nr:MAG TPA: HEAT SHOCK COGNATE 71 KDA-PROTEIN COMPLEX, APOPTOSIS, PROTEIN FOLDING.9A [Caudoviricetes sp.]